MNLNKLNEELSPDFIRNLDLVEGFYGQKFKKCTFKNIIFIFFLRISFLEKASKENIQLFIRRNLFSFLGAILFFFLIHNTLVFMKTFCLIFQLYDKGGPGGTEFIQKHRWTIRLN